MLIQVIVSPQKWDSSLLTIIIYYSRFTIILHINMAYLHFLNMNHLLVLASYGATHCPHDCHYVNCWLLHTRHAYSFHLKCSQGSPIFLLWYMKAFGQTHDMAFRLWSQSFLKTCVPWLSMDYPLTQTFALIVLFQFKTC